MNGIAIKNRNFIVEEVDFEIELCNSDLKKVENMQTKRLFTFNNQLVEIELHE